MHPRRKLGRGTKADGSHGGGNRGADVKEETFCETINKTDLLGVQRVIAVHEGVKDVSTETAVFGRASKVVDVIHENF